MAKMRRFRKWFRETFNAPTQGYGPPLPDEPISTIVAWLTPKEK